MIVVNYRALFVKWMLGLLFGAHFRKIIRKSETEAETKVSASYFNV